MVFVVLWKATFSSPLQANVASMPPLLSNLQWKAFARLRSVRDQHLNEPSGNWSGEGRCHVIKYEPRGLNENRSHPLESSGNERRRQSPVSTTSKGVEPPPRQRREPSFAVSTTPLPRCCTMSSAWFSSFLPSGAESTSMPCVRDRLIKRSGGGGAVVASSLMAAACCGAA